MERRCLNFRVHTSRIFSSKSFRSVEIPSKLGGSFFDRFGLRVGELGVDSFGGVSGIFGGLLLRIVLLSFSKESISAERKKTKELYLNFRLILLFLVIQEQVQLFLMVN